MFSVVLAIAALRLVEFVRIVFEINAVLGEVRMLLYERMKFIWTKGRDVQRKAVRASHYEISFDHCLYFTVNVI